MTDIANRDANRVTSLLARDYTNAANEVAVTADPATGRLLTQTMVAGVLIPSNYDYIAYTNTNTTTDTYVYKTGGAGGVTVATVTVTYTDGTKAVLSNVART